jgi:hypothetical protein
MEMPVLRVQGEIIMKVLVACEFSGRIRNAFKDKGHDAWSCDFFDSEIYGQHMKEDVTPHLNDGWDLMIAHPPCTHLAVSGARYFKEKKEEQAKALEFVRVLMNAPIPKICIENPISVISSHIRKPDQIVQPWMFGEPESKATCPWLKGLPKLQPTEILPLPENGIWKNQTASGQNKLSPGPDRWRERSRTYTGIALAMASQWG